MNCAVRHSGDVAVRPDQGLVNGGGALRTEVVADTRKAKAFTLLPWFSLLSLVCIVLLSVGLASVLSRFMVDTMTRRDAEISAQFVDSLAHAEPMIRYFEGPQTVPADPVVMSFIESFFGHFLIQSDVIRANIYLRNRTVAWSSTPSLVGTSFGPNSDLEEALSGTIAIELGTVGVDDKAEHIEFESSLRGTRYIETYIPVWSRDRRSVVAAVEIYRLTDDLFKAIDNGMRLVWYSTLLGGALLFLALFGIVRRAGIIIRQQQERLVESEFMAAIGEMASMIAHGIRNPLASVRSSAELISLHDLDGARSAAKDIVNSVDLLNEWIRSFLYHANSDVREWAKTDCNAVIRNCLSEWTRALQRQGVELTLDIDDALPLVSGHPVILGHALNSLIANALEAMPDGGELHVSTAATGGRRLIEIRISDSGREVRKDIAGRLFRPLTTTKSAGLGLGLALSRRVFERSGGGLELTAVHGGGVLAVVRLPAAD